MSLVVTSRVSLIAGCNEGVSLGKDNNRINFVASESCNWCWPIVLQSNSCRLSSKQGAICRGFVQVFFPCHGLSTSEGAEAKQMMP